MFAVQGPKYFDGKHEYIYTNILPFNLFNDITISLWITSFSRNDSVLVSMGRDAHSRRVLSQNVALFSLDLLGDGRLSFFEQGLVNDVMYTSNHLTTKSVPYGIRTHIAYVKSNVTGSKFYINGKLVNTYAPDVFYDTSYMTHTLCLGADCAVLDRYFVGSIDNLIIINGTVSEFIINEILNSTAGSYLRPTLHQHNHLFLLNVTNNNIEIV